MKITSQFRKTRLKTRLIKQIKDVSPSEWIKVYPHVPENYYFLKTLDESNFDQFSFYYILVYDRKELVGAAPCFTVDYSLDTSIAGPLRKVTNSIKKVIPNLFSLKALVCGIPMGQGQVGVAADAQAVMEAIERRMEQLARKVKAPIIAFKDFDESSGALLDPLLKRGFLKIDSLPTTHLSLNFNNFEQYLQSLSLNSRSHLRRKFKKTSHAKIEYTQAHELDEKTLQEAYKLYLQVVNTHDLGFEVLPIDFFRNIARNMPKESRFFLWTVDGKLAAFMFCLIQDDFLLDYFLGFDYEISRKYYLYFLKFKDSITWSIEHGIKKYEMGTTGYDPKRQLGFKFIPLYLYVKMRPKLIRPVLKLLRSLLKFENFDPVLKQWKKSLK